MTQEVDKLQNKENADPDRGYAQLGINEILVAEFQYIAQTAFQSNEDRARVTSFYLVSVGSLVIAILGSQFGSLQDPDAYLGFSVLFIALSISSILTILQLVRLRQAWFESVLSMNQIKEFYISKSGDTNLEHAFRWKKATMPPKMKAWSISYLQAAQVAVLGGITLGAAILFLGYSSNDSWWFQAIIFGLIFSLLQLYTYHRYLNY